MRIQYHRNWSDVWKTVIFSTTDGIARSCVGRADLGSVMQLDDIMTSSMRNTTNVEVNIDFFFTIAEPKFSESNERTQSTDKSSLSVIKPVVNMTDQIQVNFSTEKDFLPSSDCALDSFSDLRRQNWFGSCTIDITGMNLTPRTCIQLCSN